MGFGLERILTFLEPDKRGCRVCGRDIRLMCQQGTGYCSANCQDSPETYGGVR